MGAPIGLRSGDRAVGAWIAGECRWSGNHNLLQDDTVVESLPAVAAGSGWHCYLYRAIDADGNLVDSMLSATRDMTAAKRFFSRALAMVGHVPVRVTTDGHDAYPRAVRETLSPTATHRTSQYLNNRLEQDHRGSKSATTRCGGSAPLRQQPASASAMMNFATTCAPAST